MRKIIIIIPTILIALCFVGCDKKPTERFMALQEMDTTVLKPSVLQAVKSYIAEHDSNNAFFLKPISLYKKPKNMITDCIGCRNIWNQVFQIGVASRMLYYQGEFRMTRNYPNRYIKIDDKYVLITTDDGSLYNQKDLQKDILSIITDFEYKDAKYLLVYDVIDSCAFVDEPYMDERYDTIEETGVVKVKSRINFVAPPITEKE